MIVSTVSGAVRSTRMRSPSRFQARGPRKAETTSLAESFGFSFKSNGAAPQTATVQLMMTDGTKYNSYCSGALISKQWIITAGHCFHDVNRNRVSGTPARFRSTRL